MMANDVTADYVEARLVEAARVFLALASANHLEVEGGGRGDSLQRTQCQVCGARSDVKCGHGAAAARLTWSHGTAKDGPWGALTLGVFDRYSPKDDLEAAALVIERAIRMPRPDRDMIGRAEAAASWLELIPLNRVTLADGTMVEEPVTRRLVASVVRQMARTGRRPEWAGIGGPHLKGSAVAKGMRYRRALTDLAVRVRAAAGARDALAA